MIDIEDILKWCGYNSAFSMLSFHMSNEKLMHLLEDIVDSPIDAQDFVKEEVERIATDLYEWFDHERAKADAEEEAYQRYRDGD